MRVYPGSLKFLLVTLLFGCATDNRACFNVAVDPEEKKEILTKIVSNTGKIPGESFITDTDSGTVRTKPDKSFYAQMAEDYTLECYHADTLSNLYYFQISQKLPNWLGPSYTVTGGYYRPGRSDSVLLFREVYITNSIPWTQRSAAGQQTDLFFQEMVNNKNVNKYSGNKLLEDRPGISDMIP